MAHADLERERTRDLARIGSNLNQIARWANTYRENAEAVEVIAHLAAIERALDIWPSRGTESHDGQVSRSRRRTTSPVRDSPIMTSHARHGLRWCYVGKRT